MLTASHVEVFFLESCMASTINIGGVSTVYGGGVTDKTLPIIGADGSKRYASWSEAATWFDAALRVKREQCPTCPTLNRRLFVMAVRLWGIIR